jgi:hypothetical protein
VPIPFAEGRYNKRLKFIGDTPKSAVVWYFDQTDMAEAKVLGNSCCIMGNNLHGDDQLPQSVCRKLIADCARRWVYSAEPVSTKVTS